jgi:hypothetical protein
MRSPSEGATPSAQPARRRRSKYFSPPARESRAFATAGDTPSRSYERDGTPVPRFLAPTARDQRSFSGLCSTRSADLPCMQLQVRLAHSPRSGRKNVAHGVSHGKRMRLCASPGGAKEIIPRHSGCRRKCHSSSGKPGIPPGRSGAGDACAARECTWSQRWHSIHSPKTQRNRFARKR